MQNIKRKKYNFNNHKLEWALALMAIVLTGAYWFYSKSTKAINSLPSHVKENYVAVLPFKNNTGKEEMSVIGEMAADWITTGLHETGEGKILSAGEVSRIIENVQYKKGTLDNSISQQTDVHYLLEGTYYEIDSALMISSSMKNLENGEIVFKFPLIQGNPKAPLESIEKVKQHILGYWVTKDRDGYESRPPIYEAYKAYLETRKLWYSDRPATGRLLEKAIKLDSNFYIAKISYAEFLISSSSYTKADSVYQNLVQKKHKFSHTELNLLKALQARLTGNSKMHSSWVYSKRAVSYWGELMMLKQKTEDLLFIYNQPQSVIDLLKNIDFSIINYDVHPYAKYLYFYQMIAHYRLEQYQETKTLLINPPFEMLDFGYHFNTKIAFLAKIEAFDQIEENLKLYDNSLGSTQATHYIRMLGIEALYNLSNDEISKQKITDYLQFLEEENKDHRRGFYGMTLENITANLYLMLEQPKKITSIIEKGEGIGNSDKALALKGIYYAQMKNEPAAREMIDSLKIRDTKYHFGIAEYNIAVIETHLGNHQIACDLLVEARKRGTSIRYQMYDGDWRLKPLLNHQDFKTKILAPLSLPELELSSSNDSKISQNYWLTILGLLLAAFGFILFIKSRKRKPLQSFSKIKEEFEIPPVKTEDEFLIKLKSVIAANLNDVDYSMPQLCKAMGVSRAQIYRKIKDLTDQSPSRYIRSFRLQKAQELLKTTDLNISEIGYEVGFRDLAYFSRSFTEEYGISPSESRKG